MCGITGYINLNSRPVKDSAAILKMLRVQKHRGPDDSGIRAFSLKYGNSVELPVNVPVAIDEGYEGVLGFNRLSILDLSLNGHQPMASPDQKVLLTLNGEIYNAFDFKNELIEWGYIFKSTGDTEIVLALYLKYGFEGMLQRLNGMFAIVIADLRERKLYIARDRFGIKPIYYILSDKLIAFSSELKSFRYLDGFKFSLNETQLNEFLLFRSNIHGTLLKDIQPLEPGRYLKFSYDQGVEIKQYFDINDCNRTHEPKGAFALYEKNLESLLDKSVRIQLMSDVKLGCQLSGGIDSSLVTYYANKNSHKGQFESVSIVFDDPLFSEEKFIDKVAGQLNIDAHKFLLDSAYYLDHLEKATWHFESPINHPNTIAIYLLSQKAKEYVTVLLSGEGADEVFGGYRRFYDVSYPFRNTKFLSHIKNNLKNPGCLFSYLDPVYRTLMSTSYMNPSIAEKLVAGFDMEQATESRKSLYKSLTGSVFDRQVKYEIQTYLPDLLVRQDKMSMAHSIENRVPFLDNDIVTGSFAIPEKCLLFRKSPEGYNTEKYLLKKLTSSLFGNEFAFREKMGFGVPIRGYFKNADFNNYLNDNVLTHIRQRGIMNYTLISGWIENISSLQFQEIDSLWIAITFELWASLYLDR